jgi:hypothetical protein
VLLGRFCVCPEHSANIIVQDDELLSFTSDDLLSFTSNKELANVGIPDDSEASSKDLGSLAEDFLDFNSNENTLDNSEIPRQRCWDD